MKQLNYLIAEKQKRKNEERIGCNDVIKTTTMKILTSIMKIFNNRNSENKKKADERLG